MSTTNIDDDHEDSGISETDGDRPSATPAASGQTKAKTASDVSTEMRDCNSFTGVSCATKNMAVAPDAHSIAFKKDKRLIHIFDTNDVSASVDLGIDGLDAIHANDQIFDLCFLGDEHLVLLLQDTDANRIFICRGQIDRLNRRLRIDSNVVDTHMAVRNGVSVSLIQDERGPVLVSYPLRFINATESHVDLLHLYDYFRNDGGRKLTVWVKTHPDGLWSDPFISRNTLYLLNRFDCNLMCIGLSGKKIGVSRLLKTYGDPNHRFPNHLFVNKCVQVLDDMTLVYFHQRVDNPKCKPQLWKLELSSMQWRRLQLSLSNHFPMSRVSLQKARDDETAYLHGDCGFADCPVRVHLYELALDHEAFKTLINTMALSLSHLNQAFDRVSDTVRRSLSVADIHCQPSTSVSPPKSPKGPAPPPPPSPSGVHVPPAMRYANRRGQANNLQQKSASRPQSIISSGSSGNVSTVSLPAYPNNGRQYVHWSDQMADDGSGVLVVQLSAAKEMGYTDEEIFKALEMNGKDGYRSFPSTSAMVDMLIRVKSMQNLGQNAVGDLDAQNGNGERRTGGSPSRIPTCNGHCSCTPIAEGETIPLNGATRSPPLQLQRLLDAFEKERRSYEEEHQKAITRITERCHQAISVQNQLQSELRQKEAEISQMRIKLHDHRNMELQLATAKRQLEQQQQNEAAKSIELRQLQEETENARKDFELGRIRMEKEMSELRNELKQCQTEIQPQLRHECEALKKRCAQMSNELNRFGRAKEELARLNEAIERISLERDGFRAQLSKMPTCVVCLDKQPQLLFLPCSHFVCCESCGKNLDTCPTCRAKLCGKCRAFQ